MLQNKKLFRVLLVLFIVMGVGGIALVATKNTSIKQGSTIPASTNLRSVPPQATMASDYSSVIHDIPTTLSYTKVRDLQDTIGYLANPDEKNTVHDAEYRNGSEKTENDGRVSFLVDVADVKKTFIVYDSSVIDCAPQSRQKEPSWQCSLPEGGDFE